MKSENKIWIELLYVLVAALIAVGLILRVAGAQTKSKPEFIAVPCDCVSV